MLGFLAIILAGLGTEKAPLLTVPDTEESAVVGSCKTIDGRSINLNRALIIEPVKINFGDEYRIQISGERIHFHRDNRDKIVDAQDVINKEQDLDILLKFAVMKGKLLIYWKETYRHRSYRQGLIEIKEDELEAICEGTGGLDRSH